MTKTFARFTHAAKQFRLLLVLVTLVATSFSLPARADMIGTQVLAGAAELEGKRDELRSLLARADVRQALLDHGVSPGDVDLRVGALSDAEIQQLHGKIADLPAGQSFIGAVLGIIVIFMLLDMAGVTDIFPSI